MNHFNTRLLLSLFLVIAASTPPIDAVDSRKLDETTVPGTTNQGDQKCMPCTQNSPPPPSPPPPALPPPPPPPPSPKKPPTPYCPPPPSAPALVPPSLVYTMGPPGNLYPIDDNFNGASRKFAVGLPAFLTFGLFSLLAFW